MATRVASACPGLQEIIMDNHTAQDSGENPKSWLTPPTAWLASVQSD